MFSRFNILRASIYCTFCSFSRLPRANVDRVVFLPR
jgi:hypothetical protein